LNSLFVVAILLAYISPFVDPNITSLFSIFGLFYIILLYINIAFIIIWLVIKPKIAFMSALAIFIGWGSLIKNIGFNTKESESQGLAIMTYNIGKTRYEMTKDNASEKMRHFEKIISDAKPDVICIQERVKWHMSYYDSIFSSYNLYAVDQLGTAIYTNLPVIDSGNIAFDTKSHNGTWTDLVYRNDTLRIYSIHLSSNHVTQVTGEMLDKPDIRNKKMWGDIRFVLSKYSKHTKIRVQQLKRILAHSATSPYPVILAGDFNDIPQSYLYNMMSSKYKDAFRSHGKGIQKTFISSIPGLRIDYTFVDKGIQVLDQRLIKSQLSDHYPLLTKLHLVK
jgi:endonuclease/exonuclease/phosphatase family metal-dependent hydrolase